MSRIRGILAAVLAITATPRRFATGVVSPDGRYLFFLRRSGGRTHVWWVELDLTTRLVKAG